MKFFRIILISLAIIIALIVIVSFFLPREYKITRTILIESTISPVYSKVVNFQSWVKWNPWSKIDSHITYQYIISDSVRGSSMMMSCSNTDVGNVRREIIGFVKDNSITSAMTIEGRTSGSEEWTFTKKDKSTEVRWTIHVRLGFFFRILAPMLDYKTGAMMEEGLHNLKTLIETAPDVNLKITQEYLQSQMYIVRRGTAKHNDPTEISTTMSKLYSELLGFASYYNLIITGQPIAINVEWGDNYIFEAGLPVANVRLPQGTGGVKFVTIAEGKVVRGVYTGPYSSLSPAYDKIQKYITDNNLMIEGYSWEEYISDPAYIQPDSLITYIYFPVK